MLSILRKVVKAFAKPVPKLLFGSFGAFCISKRFFLTPIYAAPVAEHEKGAVPNYSLGAMVEEEEPAKSQGLKVIVVKPNSIAESHNLQEGDIIVAVDDMSVRTLKAYKVALYKYATLKKVFSVIREGKTIKIEIDFAQRRND